MNSKRTSAGLRDLLFEMIEGVRAGTVDDKKARTIATLSQSILKSVEVELQFRAQFIANKGDLPAMGALVLSTEVLSTEMTGAAPRFVKGSAQSGSS